MEFSMSDIEEQFLILPTLQEIASYKVGIELWYLFISKEDPCRESCWKTSSDYRFCFLNDKDEEKVKGAVRELPLPQSLLKLVENCIEHIKYEMNRWAYVHQKFNFKEEEIKIGDLMFCYWLPDGKIDYRRTAQNMLSNPSMTLDLKFKIASKYCLVDEIMNFPIILTWKALGMWTETRDESSLIRYWLRNRKINQFRLPLTFGERLDSFMITARDVNTWSAIEYFWDRLSLNEQTDKIREILRQKPEFQKNLFAKMNRYQRFFTLCKMPLQIMETFWKRPDEEKFAFWTWIHIQKLINERQFEEMMLMLCSVPSMCEIDKKVECLTNIWNHCPDNFKQIAIQPNITNEIIKFQTFYITNHHWSGNVDFLILYLSYLDAEVKKKIIFEQMNNIVSIIHPYVTKRVIEVCLLNAKDVANFKKSVLRSNNSQHRLGMALLANRSNVNMFLDYYCEDSWTRSEFCDRVLTRFQEPSWIFNRSDELIRIIEFIDQNLLHSLPDRALEMKKQFIMNFSQCCCQRWSNDDNTNRMTQIISQVLDTEERKKFISFALDHVQTRYYWSIFDEKKITAFLAWCFDNDTARMTEFKKNLSIDYIFNYIWDLVKMQEVDYTDLQTIAKLLETIQSCLLWYFENAEDVLAFKVKKVLQNSYKGSPIFSQKVGVEMSDTFLKNTLPWFFRL